MPAGGASTSIVARIRGDFGDRIAGFDEIALAPQPARQPTRLHRRIDGGHQDIDRHVPPRSPIQTKRSVDRAAPRLQAVEGDFERQADSASASRGAIGVSRSVDFRHLPRQFGEQLAPHFRRGESPLHRKRQRPIRHEQSQDFRAALRLDIRRRTIP